MSTIIKEGAKTLAKGLATGAIEGTGEALGNKGIKAAIDASKPKNNQSKGS